MWIALGTQFSLSLPQQSLPTEQQRLLRANLYTFLASERLMHLPIPAQELLPHKGPMCCIDFLVHVTPAEARGTVTLLPNHVLVHEGELIAAGFIELAAQTAGAMQGYWQKKEHLPVRVGYLVAVQNFSMLQPAYVGDALAISVAVQGELEGVSILVAAIHRHQELLAQGKLKVFVKE